jgi:hypothetical protein
MRRLAVVLALALTVAAPAAAKEPGRAPVLAITWELDRGTLVRVNPVSLEPAGWSLALGTFPEVLARSPDGRYLAVLSHAAYPAGLLVVDTERMRVVRAIRTGYVLGAAWLRPHRLLLVMEPGLLGIVDPLRRRPVRWKFFQGSIGQWARTRDGLLVLSGPAPRGLGQARLFVISAAGGVHAITLPGIRAGWDDENQRVEMPGLAVDPTGTRAVVVSACSCVALQVALQSGAMDLHALGTRRLAKAGSGPLLTAVWVGRDLVAVSGRRLEDHQSSPIGLALLDTQVWSLRWIERGIWGVVGAGDGVLGLGTNGLSAYAGDGTHRFAYPDAGGVTVAGAYAYVQRVGDTHVVELATGRVVGSAPVRISVIGEL